MDQLFFPRFETEMGAKLRLAHRAIVRGAESAEHGAHSSIELLQLADCHEARAQDCAERSSAEDEFARAQLAIQLPGRFGRDVRR